MRWHYRHSVLALCMFAFLVTYFARLAISPVIPLITAEFEVTNTAIGMALTGMWLTYGLAQFPSGILAERFGERRVILVSVGGTVLMGLLLALAPVFPLFVASTVALGAVAGLHYSVATTLLSRTFDDVGRAVGIHSVGGPLAGLVAPVAAAWVGSQYGWRPAVALAAVVGVPVFALFAWRVRPTPPRHPGQRMRERFELGSLMALVSRPPIVFTLFVAALGTFVAQGLLSFLPTFLIETRGTTATVAGVAFSAFFVVRGGGQIVLGELSDRLGRDFALGVSMFAGGAGLLLLVVAPGRVVAGVAILLAGIGSSFFAALDPRFIDNLSEAERGAGFGLVRTVYTMLGSSGSVGVGLLADTYGWETAFTVLAGLFLITTATIAVNSAFELGY
uniref:MFS transporter n=1 Tax=Haloprofundus sp. MHR1 TaxID=2572921 RepID=UPI001F2D716B|nr:MFS transporter [Haloprofundus sp. MHR1]